MFKEHEKMQDINLNTQRNIHSNSFLKDISSQIPTGVCHWLYSIFPFISRGYLITL